MKIWISLLGLLFSAIINAQEISIPVKFISAIKELPERYEGTDTFDWQYTITKNVLRKEKDGRFLEYKNVSLGDIYKVDIQNPLQIVIFYRKFNTVVLLDNQLNETNRINFSTIQEPVITEAAGLAAQNRLWIYDVNSQRLGLYSFAEGQFIAITPPFTDNISYYQSDYNYFYWIDASGKCFACNLFGKISFLGNVPKSDQVQIISSNKALIKQADMLYLLDIPSGTTTPIHIVEKSFSGFYYTAQILSIFTEREINQYKITLPE